MPRSRRLTAVEQRLGPLVKLFSHLRLHRVVSLLPKAVLGLAWWTSLRYVKQRAERQARAKWKADALQKLNSLTDSDLRLILGELPPWVVSGAPLLRPIRFNSAHLPSWQRMVSKCTRGYVSIRWSDIAPPNRQVTGTVRAGSTTYSASFGRTSIPPLAGS